MAKKPAVAQETEQKKLATDPKTDAQVHEPLYEKKASLGDGREFLIRKAWIFHPK